MIPNVASWDSDYTVVMTEVWFGSDWTDGQTIGYAAAMEEWIGRFVPETNEKPFYEFL